MFRPKEITAQILNFLDYSSLKTCCLLSKYFLQLGRETLIHQKINEILNKIPEKSPKLKNFEEAFNNLGRISDLAVKLKIVNDTVFSLLITSKLAIIQQALEHIEYRLNDPQALTSEQRVDFNTLLDETIPLEKRNQSLARFFEETVPINAKLFEKQSQWETRAKSLAEASQALKSVTTHPLK